MKTLLTVALFFSSSVPMLTQRSQTPPLRKLVIFECACKDQLGLKYAIKIKDLLGKSPRYLRIQPEPKPSSVWTISAISTGAPGFDDDAHSIALSIAITYAGNLKTHIVLTCSSKGLDECASDTLSALDSEAESSS